MSSTTETNNNSAAELTAALGTLQGLAALPGDGLPTPGAPGVVNIDEMDDDVGAKQGVIGDFGMTDDLTPMLQGNLDGGEGLVLRVYANTEFLGTTVVDDNGNWTFTPEGLESGSKYTFEVLLPDPLSSEILVSQPYTIITTAPDQDNTPVVSGGPQIGGVWDDVGPQQGPIHSGDTTDDAAPTLFGTTEPGDVVTVYDNGQPIGSVTADDHGNWAFTPDTPLDDGAHSLTVTAQGADGNPSEPSAPVDFTVDTSGLPAGSPDAATDLALTDDVGPVTGPIVSGDTTDDTQPTLTGKATPGDTVMVSDNGNVIGSAAVDGDGNWSFTPATALADGVHSLSAVVQDAAGNQSPATDPIVFDVATTTTVIVSDTLQHVFNNNAYIGDGFVVTANTPLTHTDWGSSKHAGLNIDNSATADNYLQINFTNPATEVGFNISALQNDDGGSRVVIKDTNGNVIYDQMVTADGDPSIMKGNYNDFSFTAPEGTTIGSVQVYGDHTDGGNQLGGIVLSSLQYQYDRPYNAETDRGSHEIHQDYEALQYNTTDNSYSGDNFTITTNANLLHDPGHTHGFPGLYLGSTGGQTDGYELITFNHAVSEVDFRISGLQNSEGGSRVVITDTSGNVIYDQMVTSNGDASMVDGDYTTFSFTAAEGVGIASVQVYNDHFSHTDYPINGETQTDGGITLDNLHFTYADDTQAQPLMAAAQPELLMDAPAPETRSADVEQLAQSAALGAEQVAALPGDGLPTPGAPGPVNIDEVDDDVGVKQGVIGDYGLTDDLTPTLQGNLDGGAGLVLRVYANTEFLGTTVVDDNGNWTFTPEGLESGSKYTFEVLLPDPLSSEILISQPYTIITTPPDQDNTPVVSGGPEIGGVWDDVGPQQGPVFNGDTTDDNQPTVIGTSAPGDVVTVYDNGQPIGSTTADDQGNWAFTPDAPLDDGSHSLTATTPDADGNPGAPSAPVDFTVDTSGLSTAPEAATDLALTDDVGPETGPIANGDTTDDTQPTLTGKATPDDTVIVSDNGKVIGSATVDGDGNWSFTPATALDDGPHSFSTVVQDAAGNQSPATTPIAFEVATNTTVIVSDTLQHVFDTNAYIGDGFIITANTALTHDTWGPSKHAGLNIDNSATTDNYMQIDFTNPATRVSFNISALQNDDGGSRVVIKDTNGNVIYDQMVRADGESSVMRGNYNDFSFTAPEGTIIGSVQVYGDHTDGGNQLGGIVLSSLQYQYDRPYDAPIDRGSHLIHQDYEALQYNPSGRSYSGSNFNFTITSNTNLTHVDANSTSFDGLWLPNADANGVGTDANNYLLINMNEPATEVDFRLSGLQNSSGGSHVIITGTDGTVLYDQMVTSHGSASVANGDYANFSFSAPQGEYIGSVQVYGDNAYSGLTLDNLHFTWPQPLVERATGLALNDDVGPLTGAVRNGDTTDDTQPTLTGHATPGDTVLVSDNGTQIGSTTVDSDGNWSFTPATALADGDHSLTAVVQDAAGNQSWQTAPLAFTVDSASGSDIATAIINDTLQFDVVNNVYNGDGFTITTNGSIGHATGPVDPNAAGAPGVYLTNDSSIDSWMQINFTHPVNDLSFTINGLSNGDGGSRVVVKDSDGNVLYDQKVESDGDPAIKGGTYTTFSFTAPEGTTVGSVQIYGDYAGTSGVSIDHLQYQYEGRYNAVNDMNSHEIHRDHEALQYNPTDNSYTGDNFTITSNAAMTHYAGDAFDFAGVNIPNSASVDNYALISFDKPASVVDFRISGLENNDGGSRVVIKDSGGNVIYDQQVQADGDPNTVSGQYHDFTFSALAGENIASVQVYGDHVNSDGNSGGSITLDHLDFTYYVGDEQVQSSVLMSTQAQPAALTLDTLPDDAQHTLASQATVDLHDSAVQTLNLTENDILSHAQQDLFLQDGKQQLAVTGDQGDTVNLNVDDVAHQWNDAGASTVGGVNYEVYQNSAGSAELLVQQGLELHQTQTHP